MHIEICVEVITSESTPVNDTHDPFREQEVEYPYKPHYRVNVYVGGHIDVQSSDDVFWKCPWKSLVPPTSSARLPGLDFVACYTKCPCCPCPGQHEDLGLVRIFRTLSRFMNPEQNLFGPAVGDVVSFSLPRPCLWSVELFFRFARQLLNV